MRLLHFVFIFSMAVTFVSCAHKVENSAVTITNSTAQVNQTEKLTTAGKPAIALAKTTKKKSKKKQTRKIASEDSEAPQTSTTEVDPLAPLPATDPLAPLPETGNDTPTNANGTLTPILPPAETFSEPPGSFTESSTQGTRPRTNRQRQGAPQALTTDAPAASEKLQICNFNIQFLGNFRVRDNQALANFMKDSNCDIVVVQELVAPPNLATLYTNEPALAGHIFTFPDNDPIRPNELNTDFFQKMHSAGFDKFWLSDQDTGNKTTNKDNSSATEWFVVFFKGWKVKPKLSLPHGFLDADVTANANYDRVPYAFSFVTRDEKFDFVLISVHLHPGAPGKDRARRKVELDAIENWINTHNQTEKDIIVMGDMNLEDNEELADVVPAGYVSLNTNAAAMTNTNIMSPKPYDHVMINSTQTTEVRPTNNFTVLNLLTGLRPYWTGAAEQYPGLEENYRLTRTSAHPSGHDTFRQIYSDHHPVKFEVNTPARDDD